MPRDRARELIEHLEEGDIPTHSIAIEELAVSTDPSPREGRLFGDVGRRVTIGAVFGAIVGLGIGAVTIAITDVPAGLGLIAGLVFGAFAGVAIGGLGVVRFASPAWREAGDDGTPALVLVSVYHDDRSVVTAAVEVIEALGHQPEARSPG